jgi:hypothetical protein
MIAHALSKTRLMAKDAKFGEAEAQAFGIVWEEDLFAPADEDGRSQPRLMHSSAPRRRGWKAACAKASALSRPMSTAAPAPEGGPAALGPAWEGYPHRVLHRSAQRSHP